MSTDKATLPPSGFHQLALIGYSRYLLIRDAVRDDSVYQSASATNNDPSHFPVH